MVSGSDATIRGDATPHKDNVGRGILLTVLAIMIFGFQDAVAKVLVQDYTVPHIIMMRYWAFGLFSLWLVTRRVGLRRAFQAKRPGLQILRGLLLLADLYLFATAVRTLPLGELMAIILLFPMLVTLFSIPLLGEKVGMFRLVSVGVGFIGVLIVLRPGFAIIDVGAFYGLAAAVVFALYTVVTRMVSHEDSTGTAMLYVGMTGLVISNVVGVFFWEPMTLKAFGLLAILWVTTTTAHFLVMRSLVYAPASVVQPFNYLALPWAITLSYLVFGHLIDFTSLVGAIIIVGAGLVVWARERRQVRRIS